MVGSAMAAKFHERPQLEYGIDGDVEDFAHDGSATGLHFFVRLKAPTGRTSRRPRCATAAGFANGEPRYRSLSSSPRRTAAKVSGAGFKLNT